MKYIWTLAALLALASLATGCGGANDENKAGRQPAKVVILAAASLRETVTDIAREWSKRSGVECVTQFDATSTLGMQISEGAHTDVFLAAAPEWLDKVKPLDRHDWLTNRLVLVVSKDAKDVQLSTLPNLALANEQVPAGKYAKAALEHLRIKLPDRIIYGASVRDVLSKVSEGGAAAGIVYATDAGIDPNVRIAYTFPAESHPPIRYSAGLLTENGKALFGALREPWAIAIARKHGFEPLTP